jgi:hypothetical protein
MYGRHPCFACSLQQPAITQLAMQVARVAAVMLLDVYLPMPCPIGVLCLFSAHRPAFPTAVDSTWHEPYRWSYMCLCRLQFPRPRGHHESKGLLWIVLQHTAPTCSLIGNGLAVLLF